MHLHELFILKIYIQNDFGELLFNSAEKFCFEKITSNHAL